MTRHEGNSLAPPPPRSLSDVGLSTVMMRDILIKTMFRQNLDRVVEIGKAVALPGPVTQELLDLARSEKLIETTGSTGSGTLGEMAYRLTEQGRARALDALGQSEYFGPMPVPLESYREQVARRSIRDIQITREALTGAMGDMILPPELIGSLGPAVSSGRSILMYGPPGNGKSSLSSGIRDAVGGRIFVPHAVAYSGQVITVYDPVVHSQPEKLREDPTRLRLSSNRFDERYVLCNRPTVITGGELSLAMLDLIYNPTARTYQAPLQLKAAGGIFIVDDLGRQEEPPQALINRWIVPLEESRDILSLQSGEKFTVPFDTLVIFSTNFHPNRIFDNAALRRIFFKIKVDGPSREDFIRIFELVAEKKAMPLDRGALDYLVTEKYAEIGHVYANYQPAFLIDQMIAICKFEGTEHRMSRELIDRAWANMFVREEEIVA